MFALSGLILSNHLLLLFAELLVEFLAQLLLGSVVGYLVVQIIGLRLMAWFLGLNLEGEDQGLEYEHNWNACDGYH